jgi:NDP-sugar pyrophosphorylase family protein
MQAVILAGGKGTRLQPYTLVFPKPMLPVGGVPIISTLVQQLSFFGFTDIIISLGYMREYIRLYFGDSANMPEGSRIRYSYEEEPLGTAGPVSMIDGLEENFLVINGDILSTIDYRDFYDYHIKKDALLSIAVGIKEVKVSLGVLELDKENRITDFREKPTYTFNDNMGIYIYNRRALEYIPRNKRLDMNDLVLDLIRHEQKVIGYISKEQYYWIDVGQHADYEKANQVFLENRDSFLRKRAPR